MRRARGTRTATIFRPTAGISKGLGPLLPLFDHLITTLVLDLKEHGLLDDVLVIAMGEFGRTPILGTQGSTDGRNHWPVCMSLAMAGGGFRHGQVIGATEADGGQIKDRPVTPGDLAATIYQHMGVPLTATYQDPRGRPRMIVENGAPLQRTGVEAGPTGASPENVGLEGGWGRRLRRPQCCLSGGEPKTVRPQPPHILG